VDFAFRLRGIPRFFVEMVVLVEEMLRLQREHAEAEALSCIAPTQKKWWPSPRLLILLDD
jgi:hypothetical protein